MAIRCERPARRDERPGEPFPAFDRFHHLSAFADTPVRELLGRFREARRESLAELAALGLGRVQLTLTAVHPTFGTVTLAQQLATWVAHDLAHLTQVTRTMARRYAEDVGPWREFLSVMRDRPGA